MALEGRHLSPCVPKIRQQVNTCSKSFRLSSPKSRNVTQSYTCLTPVLHLFSCLGVSEGGFNHRRGSHRCVDLSTWEAQPTTNSRRPTTVRNLLPYCMQRHGEWRRKDYATSVCYQRTKALPFSCALVPTVERRR